MSGRGHPRPPGLLVASLSILLAAVPFACGFLAGGLAATPAVAQGIWQVYLYGNETRSLAARGEEVWAGSSGGLVRLRPDGTLTQWNRASQGLLSDSVTAVAVDDAGRIWCGTERAGISIFDPDEHSWTPFTSLQQPIPGDEIRRLRFSGAGAEESLLVGARQGYAVMVGGELRGACLEGIDICNLPSYDVADLLSAEGELWAATSRGAASVSPGGTWVGRSAGLGGAALLRLARADSLYASGTAPRALRDSIWTWRGDRWRPLPGIPGAPASYRVHDMLSEGEALLVATTGGVFRRLGGVWSPVGDLSVWTTAPGDTAEVMSLARTASGRLHAGVANSAERRDGIWSLEGETWRQHRLDGPSLRQYYRSVFFDSEGTLWVSAAQRRRVPYVLRIRDGVWTILDGNAPGRLNAWTWRIRELGGEIWLGHCCCSEAVTCRLERIRGGADFQAWPPYNIRDLDPDGNGGLWLASTGADVQYANGVYRVSPSDSTWIQVRSDTPGAELVSDQVSCIRFDGFNVWIGYEDFGVSRWSLGGDRTPLTDDDRWTHFDEDDPLRAPPLIGNRAKRIEIGSDGRVWIGTTSGLSIWNGERFSNIGAGFGRLPAPDVNDILPTDDGGAWVATRGGGVTRLRPREQGGFFYTTYGPPDLPNPNVEAIALAPDRRTLWFATERGLASFLPSEQSELVSGPKIGAYPNPYYPHCVDGLRLLGTGGDVRGVIVDLSGRVLARFPADGRRTQDPLDPIWDGTDGGAAVAPGLYWIRVQTPRGESSLGVAVLDGECP